MVHIVDLILTRHGETLENRQDIMQGHMQGTLSPLGIQQAADLANLLREEPIDVVVSSDLNRSYDTAVIVAEPHGLKPHPTELLREIDWGKYTGQRLSSMDWKHLPEGCETLEELMKRAAAFVDYLRMTYPGKRVLAVGHGAINRAIIAFVQGKRAQEMVDMPIMRNTSLERMKL